MGTEIQNQMLMNILKENGVKLNNPQMGTEIHQVL